MFSESNYQFSTLPKLVARGLKLTPMMEQYYQIKKDYLHAIVLFRMGDFFEVFFEDAELLSRILNITLTTRGSIEEVAIPMAGIPHHAISNYIEKLSSEGVRVVICDQIEDPKIAKGIVKRAVTQIIGPGIPFDIDRLNGKAQCFLACGYVNEDQSLYTLILVDYTHGDFFAINCPTKMAFEDQLQLYKPKEIIAYKNQWTQANTQTVKDEKALDFFHQENILQTNIAQEFFASSQAKTYISKVAPYYFNDKILIENKNLIFPLTALCYYLTATQKKDFIKHLRPLRLINLDKFMKVSTQTLEGLNILAKNSEDSKQSLLGICDHTKTSMGHRLLKSWFQLPLKDYDDLSKRLSVLDLWTLNWNSIEKIRTSLESSRDIFRLIAKFERRKVSAQDFISISASYKSYREIKETLEKNNLNLVLDAHLLKKVSTNKIETLALEFQSSFNDELGASLENGNLFKTGISQERDQLLKSHLTVQEKMNKLESQYKEKFQLPNLRIKSNSITGFYIEISKSYINRVPAIFDRFQTLTNVERYTSKDLKKIEKEFLLAQEKLRILDICLFNEFIEKFLQTITDWTLIGQYLSLVDTFQSLTFFALSEGLTRPKMCKNKTLKIQGAWHPILKSLIGDKFIGHDFQLSSEHFFALITGPNMSGKTTFMREVAICQFLMQIGSYVPAKHATLGIIDALFSRLGANDFIFSGQSTFMVEMNEASEILRQATDRSLIILDEIGRGTSTFDGLSVAWSISEYIMKKTRAFTLFSTHYHELIDVIDKMPSAKNFTIKTISENEDVKFTYQLIEGGATQSFGIHVAKLAGMPDEIIERAKHILKKLEKDHRPVESSANNKIAANLQKQLSFFSESENSDFTNNNENNEIEIKKFHFLLNKLNQIDVDRTSPLQALEKLYELKFSLQNYNEKSK